MKFKARLYRWMFTVIGLAVVAVLFWYLPWPAALVLAVLAFNGSATWARVNVLERQVRQHLAEHDLAKSIMRGDDSAVH